MRLLVATSVLVILTSGLSAQNAPGPDSLVGAFWSAAHKASVGAQSCIENVMSGRPESGVACEEARPALEDAFEALAQLEVCCADRTRFAVRDEEMRMRDFFLAGGGLVYLVAEAEFLERSSDRRRQMEIGATLIGRQVLAEVQLEALGVPVPSY